jgi:hypothetical protein
MLLLLFRGGGGPVLSVTTINITATTAEFRATLTF